MAAIMTGIAWIGFTSITHEIEHIYTNMIRWKIDLLNIIFLILYVPVNFVAVFIIEKYGLRTAMITGTLIQLTGFWLRCLLNYNFWYLIIG